MQVKRFGVSIEEDLLKKLDSMVKESNFSNRSQAIRHLISQHEAKEKWAKNKIVAGTIVMVYDHHKRELSNKSTAIQHDYHDLILAVQHIHLDHNNCLETIALKGEAKKLTELADKLIGLKGVKHSKLVMSSCD